MTNVKARPCSPRLLPFIKFLHYHQTELPSGLERIVPNGQAHLMVNLKEDEFDSYCRVRPEVVTYHRGAILAGAHAQSTILNAAHFQHLAAIEFHPGGVGHFFATPATETCNQILNLEDVCGLQGRTLRERLLEARSSQEKFRILEELLLENIDYGPDPAVAWAIAALDRGMRVSDVASRLGLLPRTLERRFTARLGLTPKRYSRVRRLQRTMRAMRKSPNVEWISLAAQHGYYDQSHLVHEFRELADITPSAYKPHSQARNNHISLAAQ